MVCYNAYIFGWALVAHLYPAGVVAAQRLPNPLVEVRFLGGVLYLY
jgi:hypothetical protein